MTHRTAAQLPPWEPWRPLLEVPATAVDVLLLPHRDTVTDAQARGTACVWCASAPLSAETAVDLGEQKAAGPTWYPRSCRGCAAERAHRGLFDHAPMCEQCADEASRCEVGLILYRLIRQGRHP
ncbi:hypothetical protein N4P33_32190 [Streptomyces sp. 15-116A]|uniref:hypothetical protein n=1 Tax=Streptomyces sp. 15-116A TaxID=2259035 RepID=UPI0021B31892|nr:hypothetical protein [Streptomyces sp. 15-116A]MCT7356768.1 hypothetical protein [Streptomyces sp. 15-116A]